MEGVVFTIAHSAAQHGLPSYLRAHPGMEKGQQPWAMCMQGILNTVVGQPSTRRWVDTVVDHTVNITEGEPSIGLRGTVALQRQCGRLGCGAECTVYLNQDLHGIDATVTVPPDENEPEPYDSTDN